MKVIIPVAGIGTRLRPHTYSVPKVLLHVAGKPILGHILDIVKRLKIDQVVLIVGFLGDQIVEYVKKNYKFKCKFIEQKELKGLGYAINMASGEMKDDEPVLIILGDTVFEADLLPVIRGGYDALGVKKVADPRRFGIVEMKGKFVKRLIEKPEKPTTNLAAVGVYYFKSTGMLKKSLSEIIRKKIVTKNEYQLTDALQLMIDRGVKFRTFDITEWYDCGKPETLLETNRQLLQKMKPQKKLKTSILIPPVFVSKTAQVENCIIGPNVSVGDKAILKNSIIKNSIIGEQACVENSTLESSLIGNCAQIRGALHRLNVGDSSEIDLL
ncbi:MAG: NTP transferase domain-containing protein [candidate division Zixibacteria bacterium]|nr:NTP transferase domain-containing protein [candidate division Zixibacteria bacterium]